MVVYLPSYNIGRQIYIWRMGRNYGKFEKDIHTPLHICKLGLPLIMLMFYGMHGHLASTTYNT